MGRVAGRFGRSEPRQRVGAYVQGLLAGLERKNGWTLAEHAGAVSPDGMQRLLRIADWDIDGVRDDVRSYVIEHLGDPEAVLILDDTGFLKKGVRSAGVQRQYSGTAGRVENCQVGVFLAYASGHGHALIDRELYLPETWTADRERCRAAGVPDEVGFATKPRLAMAMLERAMVARVPFGWVTADEAYGQVKYLRVWLEHHDAPYVLATKRNDTLITAGPEFGLAERRADELIAALDPRAWRRLSVGAGAHGPRDYDWARGRSGSAGHPGAGTGYWPALDQRRRDRPLRLLRPAPVHPARPGLDRGLALAYRGMLRPGQERSRPRSLPSPQLPSLVRPHHLVDARPGLARRPPRPDRHRRRRRGFTSRDQGMINLTLPEIRRLIVALILRHAAPAEHVWSWSRWRRRRQQQARRCHYRRRGSPLT